jgi:hypothetical protein
MVELLSAVKRKGIRLPQYQMNMNQRGYISFPHTMDMATVEGNY